MLTLNKKWFAGIATVIVILLVTLTLLGQDHSKKNNPMNHTYDSSWWNSNVPEKYRLSDDQINQVNKIKSEYDDLIQPEIEKLSTVRGDYSDYQQQDEISSKRIREYQSEIRGIEDNLYSLKMEVGNKIRKVLNKGQRTYYNDSVFNGWCDDWGWNYSSYMGYETRNRGNMHNNNCCW